MTVRFFLKVLALVCFVVGALRVGADREGRVTIVPFDFVALGLAFWILADMFPPGVLP